jgi:hypothetical protein
LITKLKGWWIMANQTAPSEPSQKQHKIRNKLTDWLIGNPIGNIVTAGLGYAGSRIRHLGWLPSHQAAWPDILRFFTVGYQRPIGFCVYGFVAAWAALELCGAYVAYRRNPVLFANTFANRTGDYNRTPRGWLIFYFFIGIIAIPLLGEPILFLVGAIHNIWVGHPILTA